MATTPLLKLDEYELVNEAQDIRGWKAEDYAGTSLGRVADLLVDTEKEVVTAIVLDTGAEYSLRDIEINNNRILIGGQTAPQILPLMSNVPTPVAVDSGAFRLPVVEERLRVGKRRVDQGGVRITTRVVDRPVQTQVELREEHIDVVRRPVDRMATPADLEMLKEHTLDMVEKAEIATITKQARVVEEVVVKRDVSEHSETVREMVRYTDVEVNEIKLPVNVDRLL